MTEMNNMTNFVASAQNFLLPYSFLQRMHLLHYFLNFYSSSAENFFFECFAVDVVAVDFAKL